MSDRFNQETERLFAATLGTRFAGFLDDEAFTAEHERHEDHVRLTLRLDRVDETHRWVWQSLVETKLPQDQDGALFLLVDFMDAYLSEFFASDRLLRAQARFVAHAFQDVDICLRGRRRDLAAERQAAAWLGEETEADFPEET